MPKTIKLLLAHDGADLYLAELKARFPDLLTHVARTPAELEASAGFAARIAFSCVTDGIGREAQGTLRDRPGLEWLHVGGSGFEHFKGASIPMLTNGAGVLAPFLAETLIGAVIALNRGFAGAVRDQLARRWRPWSFASIEGRTLAILGTGAIGTALATRAKALGMRVVGIARRPVPRPPYDDIRPLAELCDVAGSCDFLSLNVSLTPETRHMVDAGVLAAMRPSAFLLNASRGAVADEQALVAALQERRIAGAYLDVFEQEPLPPKSPLWGLDNVLMTPHTSDRVADWELRHARFFMDNLERWLKGEALLNRVG